MTPTLNGFREHLMATESPRTLRAYLSDAAEFEAFRAGQPASIDVLEGWVGALNGVKPQTVARKLAATRRWLAFLARHADRDALETLTILGGGYQIVRGPKQVDRKQITPVTSEEVVRAYELAPSWGKVLLHLLWWSGPRISEVIGDHISGIPALTIADGQALITQGFAETSGKGGKRRTLILPMAGRPAVAAWVEGKNLAAPLFPSPTSPQRSISPQAVNQMLHAAGLEGGAHRFRHSFKERLRKADVREEIIRALLGHGPMSTTDRYGAVSLEEMLAAAERLCQEARR